MNIEDLNTLIETRPETLAKQQHDAMKNHVQDVLNKMYALVQDEKYHEAMKMLEESCAGDDMSHYNQYIDFGDISEFRDECSAGTDIGMVLKYLATRKEQS